MCLLSSIKEGPLLFRAQRLSPIFRISPSNLLQRDKFLSYASLQATCDIFCILSSPTESRRILGTAFVAIRMTASVSSYVSSFVAYLLCPTWQEEMYCSVIVRLPFHSGASIITDGCSSSYPQCSAYEEEVMRTTVLVTIGVVW